jgi:hypothetical protein
VLRGHRSFLEIESTWIGHNSHSLWIVDLIDVIFGKIQMFSAETLYDQHIFAWNFRYWNDFSAF